AQDLARLRAKRLVSLEHVRRLGQQLLVPGVQERRLARPAFGERPRLRGRPLEQPDELLERLQPQGRGPEDGVLEGVDDPEQQVAIPTSSRVGGGRYGIVSANVRLVFWR